MRPQILIILLLGLTVGAEARPPVPPRQHGPMAHPNDPVLQAEHTALLDLVIPADASHRASRDGPWSDPRTWKGDVVPGADARVLIPRNVTVTVDRAAAPVRTVRVDGVLRFAADRNTSLIVDTIVVSPSGQLVMGTSELPVAADKKAEIVFTGAGPIDTQWDPNLLSRGLISHGTVTMHGAPVTSWLALARAPRRGDTRLVLAERPTNWKKGDTLVVTGTRLLPRAKGGRPDAERAPVAKYPGKESQAKRLIKPSPAKGESVGGKSPVVKKGQGARPARSPSVPAETEDEERTILDVAGTEVTVAPLTYDHLVPAEGLSVYAGNLSRNVVLRSQNPRVNSLRGHVMFMHSPKVSLAYAGFYDLGRTDKRERVDDPQLDDYNRLLAGTGTNPRGRYSVHFHRTGIDAGVDVIPVKGCAVVNSPGWGFVNHSSHVDFEDNVAFNVDGSAFVTEAGDEIGSFRRNLAARSAGSGEDPFARNDIQDFGHEGDGFWFQGGGVSVEDNVACGQANAGFLYFTLGLTQEGLGMTRFPAANLEDRSWARGQEYVDIGEVPIRSFKRNVACASRFGYAIRYQLSGTKYGSPQNPGRSVLEGGAVWNTQLGVRIQYTKKLTLRNLKLYADPALKTGNCAVMGSNEGVHSLRYENLHIEGWEVGINVKEASDHVIEGGYFNNRTNILIPMPITSGRTVDIRGDVRFGTLAAAGGRPQYDIYLDGSFRELLQGRFTGRNPNYLFTPIITRLDTPRFRGQQLYFLEQAADWVPFKDNTAESVPEELLGKTNREMLSRYGMAVGGALAPADARREPRIHGLVAGPATYAAELRANRVQSTQLRACPVAWVMEDKSIVAGRTVDLRQGWNLVTIPVEGAPRSLVIFGGEAQRGGKQYQSYKAPAGK
jgi:hypothetical protein